MGMGIGMKILLPDKIILKIDMSVLVLLRRRINRIRAD
jgi:hypothetical protein